MFYFVHFFKGLYVNFDSETLVFVMLISIIGCCASLIFSYYIIDVIYSLNSIGDFHIITMKEDLCNMYSVKCK